MDRRQKRTRNAIFAAFTQLLLEKNFEKMTVEEIINRADVGRATFYAHFETKDFLLKELCHELFCHIFDSVSPTPVNHEHIFSCGEHGSVFLHLLKHMEQNDNHILKLFASKNNDLFLRYFTENLGELVRKNLSLFASHKAEALPEDLWICHIGTTFVNTVHWWLKNGKKESAEQVEQYFMMLI